MKLIYITIPNKSTATNIAVILVEEHLAACVNILGEIESYYVWEGKVESSNEVAMLVKVADANEALAIARIKELHPYDMPCIISLKISGGNSDFINYINSQNIS